MMFIIWVLLFAAAAAAAVCLAPVHIILRFKRVPIILTGFTAAVLFFMLLIPHITHNEFLLFYLDRGRVILICCISAAVCLTAAAAIRFRSGRNKAAILAASVPVSLCLTLISVFSFLFLDGSVIYSRCCSPDGRYCVIVRDESFLTTDTAVLYERRNPLFVRKIGALGRPFGTYSVKWDENRLECSYTDEGGYTEKYTFELQYSEGKDTHRSFGNGRFQIAGDCGKMILGNCKYREAVIPELTSFTEQNGKVYLTGVSGESRVFCVLYTTDNFLLYFADSVSGPPLPVLCGGSMTQNREWRVLDSYEEFSQEDRDIFESIL